MCGTNNNSNNENYYSRININSNYFIKIRVNQKKRIEYTANIGKIQTEEYMTLKIFLAIFK